MILLTEIFRYINEKFRSGKFFNFKIGYLRGKVMNNLREQAVNSVLWTTFRTVFSALSGPLLLLTKARYLTPEEFGVMAILNIILALLNLIENLGFSQAIIQRDFVSKEEKSSLFYFEIIFSIFLITLLMLSSPILASLYDMPQLTELIPLLSVIVFLNAPVKLFTAFMEKSFHFKELSLFQIIREITLLSSTIIFLVNGMGLLGIVAGQIIAIFTMTVLILYTSYKYKLLNIKLHFNFKDIYPFISFGIFVSAKQIFTEITHHIDEMIIGYFLSAEVLGLYHFAKNMLGRLRMLITNSFARVLFPILSKVKNDNVRLTKAYNNISKYIGVFTFPIFMGISTTAHLFIPLFFGEEWIESVPFFQILSLAFIPYLLTANFSNSLLYSVGKPHLVLYTDIFVNTIYIVLLLITSWSGLDIIFTVALYALYLIGKTMVLQVLSSKQLNSTFRSYLVLFKEILAASLLMVILVLGVQYLSVEYNNLIKFTISIITGILIYGSGIYIFNKKLIFDIKDLIIRK